MAKVVAKPNNSRPKRVDRHLEWIPVSLAKVVRKAHRHLFWTVPLKRGYLWGASKAKSIHFDGWSSVVLIKKTSSRASGSLPIVPTGGLFGPFLVR